MGGLLPGLSEPELKVRAAGDATTLTGRRALGLTARPWVENGHSAFGERDLDRLEVARYDNPWKHRLGLGAHLARHHSPGQVGEREHPHLGVAREMRRLGRRAVTRFAGAGALGVEKGGLMHE